VKNGAYNKQMNQSVKEFKNLIEWKLSGDKNKRCLFLKLIFVVKIR